MRNVLFLTLVGILLSLSSCRKDFETVASNGTLEFSKSKVYLDTVFSKISSSTYTLKVYNRSNKDISIPSIQLEKGLTSKFRLMVDGMTGNQGKQFSNVELLAKDSLYIFIEATVNVNETQADYTYNDRILFDNGNNQQSVDLVTLVQDAHFIFPTRALNSTVKEKLNIAGVVGVEGHVLTDSELHWTKDKPYVIYGYAAVPDGKTLIIDPGTKVYFHADTYSGLIVDSTAKILVNGNLNEINTTTGAIITQNEVTFEADRLEPDFEDTPGQWGTVLLFSGQDNLISHLVLKNATVGLYIQSNVSNTTAKLNIENSQIYNCSNYGILTFYSQITGQNLVINSAGQASLACYEGGPYMFTHCTFNNNWQSSKQSAVLVSDFHYENSVAANPTSVTATFKNCIIYGSNNFELYLGHASNSFAATFNHCLVKFNESGNSNMNANTDYDVIRSSNTFGNITTPEPKFKNIYKNQLTIEASSGAIGTAQFDPLFPFDILHNTRTNPSDIGAYKFMN